MALTQDEQTEQVEAYVKEIELDLPVPSIPVIDKIFCEPDFELCISLPWGVELCSGFNAEQPETVCTHVQDLLGFLNSLLSQLGPFFLVIDVFLAIQDCLQAIPEAITSLDPGAITECIEGLIEAILAILCSLYPPFAYPSLILSIIQFIKAGIECARNELQALCDAIDRINNLDNLLAGNDTLKGAEGLLAAARTNLECKTGSNIGGLGSICSIIAIVNSFIVLANELAGEELMPEIGCPDFGVDTPCDEILSILDTILEVLESFDSIIPDCP